LLSKINTILFDLQMANKKAFYLSVFRVILCSWLLVDLFKKYSLWATLYSNKSIYTFEQNSLFRLFKINDNYLKNNYQYILYLGLFLIIIYIFGIGKKYTAIGIFLFLHILQKLNAQVGNGGNNMAKLLVFYLIFANSYQYFSINKTSDIPVNNAKKIRNFVSNLAAFSIMLQLCFAYFVTFLIKINCDNWVNGSATYYSLQAIGFEGTKFNTLLANNAIIVYATTWGTLAFECGFSFLIWIKKARKILLISGILFHLSIYFLLMISGLQIIFLLPYGFFIANASWVKFAQKIKII
jgi:hypothetical protein